MAVCEMTTDRRLWPEDVAARMGRHGEGVTRGAAKWAYYEANRRRRLGCPKAGDLPPEDGRDWREVSRGGAPGGGMRRVESPWWRESTIDGWLIRRREARREAWAGPGRDRDEDGKFAAVARPDVQATVEAAPDRQPRGMCPACGRLIAVRQGGTLRGHGTPGQLGSHCPGSGSTPAVAARAS